MLLALALGLGIGLSIGLLGGGGSVLAVPALVLLLGQSVPAATTGSLAVVAAGALVGLLIHARDGRVCWRHAGAFTAAAVPGVAGGTAAGEVLDDGLVLTIFAALMLAAAVATWRAANRTVPATEEGRWERGGACPPLRLRRDLAAGAAIGFLTGLLGVGGGFLIVPTLTVALAFTLRTAVGTSLAVIAATAALGLVAHLAAGRAPDGDETVAMALGCVAGAAGAAAVAGRVPERVLGRAFALFIAAVAGLLVLEATVLGPLPGG